VQNAKQVIKALFWCLLWIEIANYWDHSSINGGSIDRYSFFIVKFDYTISHSVLIVSKSSVSVFSGHRFEIMSSRYYPLWVKGNPQLRIYLPNFYMKMIPPVKNEVPNKVIFKVPVE